MNYQPIKEYNTKIRFDLFKLESTVNDVKIIIYEKTWKVLYSVIKGTLMQI